MISVALRNTNIAFGQESKIVKTKNGLNFQQLKQVQDSIYDVIREIGGVSGAVPNNEIRIAKGLEKIKQLRRETEEAWGSCPSALKQKMDKLDKLESTLKACSEAFNNVSDAIDKEPEGLILPESCKKDGDTGIITDSSEITSAYNQLLLSKPNIGAILQQGPKSGIFNNSAIKDIKNITTLLNSKEWDFAKFNELDSKLYSQIKDTLLIGDLKKTVETQLELIDQKLQELKDTKGNFIKEVGVRVYSPETTGKIMALETAKLRRSSLKDTFIMPGVNDNLDKPDVMLLPRSDMPPKAYKIDKSFVPNKAEINEILNLNKGNKESLEKLYPEGLDVYFVPGYFDVVVGGIFNQGEVNGGVWMNAYDLESHHYFSSVNDKFQSGLKDVKLDQPTVLNGNKDRARVLAHEIGHAISIKKMNLDEASKPEKSSSIILSDSDGGFDFFTAWKVMRTDSKLTNTELHSKVKRSLSDDQLYAVHLSTDLEMIAEDIRIALTNDVLPASSKLTGCYDSTEEGKAKLKSVVAFLKKVLLEDVSPADALMQAMQTK